MKNRIIHLLSVFLFIGFVSACQSDDNLDGPSGGIEKDDSFNFSLVVPKEKVVTRSSSSMGQVDVSKLKFYLFDSANGQFIKGYDFSSEYLSDISYDEESSEYIIKMNNIERTNTLVDFVFVGNGVFVEPIGNETKEAYYKRLNFYVNSEWRESAEHFLPMWGEQNGVLFNDEFGTKHDANMMSVSLLRAVAKIDVVSKSGDVSSLKLTSISIYNSLNGGNLVPSLNTETDERNALNSWNKAMYLDPTQEDAANGFNTVDEAKQQPVRYVFEDGTFKMENPLIVPEQSGDKNMFIIVGGVYQDHSTPTYYKINLHQKDGNTYNAIDILRNHHYIVNINGVTGIGFSTEAEAYAKESSNIDLDFIIWDEGVNNGVVDGDLYFGLNTQEVGFAENSAGQTIDIPIQTNMTLAELRNRIEFKWQGNNLRYFDVDIIDAKTIQLTTLKDNLSVEKVKSTLEIHFSDDVLSVDVELNTLRLDYKIVESKTKTFGVFQKGAALTSNNYIEIVVESKQDLTGKRYEISTPEVDGYSFSADGLFEMQSLDGYYRQTLKLIGKGVSNSQSTKRLKINYNASKPSLVFANLKMAYSKKKILAITPRKDEGLLFDFKGFGYATDAGESKMLRESENCYGLTDESIVKVPSLGGDSFVEYRFDKITPDLLRRELEDTDILITGYFGFLYKGFTPPTLKEESLEIISDYVKRGGVFIFMNEDPKAINTFMSKLYEGRTDVNVSIVTGGSAGSQYRIRTYQDDPVVNGPFGNVSGKYWGEDTSDSRLLRDLPIEDFYVYSDGVPFKEIETQENTGVSICRHRDYNFLYIGDGGFISKDENLLSFLGGAFIWLCPFDFDQTLQLPVPRKYGKVRNVEVYNSVFFANALAWAIDAAEFRGQNSFK